MVIYIPVVATEKMALEVTLSTGSSLQQQGKKRWKRLPAQKTLLAAPSCATASSVLGLGSSCFSLGASAEFWGLGVLLGAALQGETPPDPTAQGLG